jgi:hypothetical protein
MVTKICLDWLVQLKRELVHMGTPDHSPQQLSPSSWNAGYSVVNQYYSSEEK